MNHEAEAKKEAKICFEILFAAKLFLVFPHEFLSCQGLQMSGIHFRIIWIRVSDAILLWQTKILKPPKRARRKHRLFDCLTARWLSASRFHQIEMLTKPIHIENCPLCLKPCDMVQIDFDKARGKYLVSVHCHGDRDYHEVSLQKVSDEKTILLTPFSTNEKKK